MNDSTPAGPLRPPTLDLADLARVGRGDRVEVRGIRDSTQELFDRTLVLLDRRGEEATGGARTAHRDPARYLPEHPDLRTIYRLAEAVGGYEAFHDLVNANSPGLALFQDLRATANLRRLSEAEVRQLGEYQTQIHESLEQASGFLRDVAVREFTREELHELHEVILAASSRARELNRIMGIHLMHEVDRAVEELAGIREKMRKVEHTVSGIFLVDSEVLFIPAEELVRIVNTLFAAVGNSYLARNVDGVVLLAARNLLIDVVSFYSYYGRSQIYRLFQRAGTAAGTRVVTARIRHEIRRLFTACRADNRLVLTRIMQDAEREFELSVEAIRGEAEDAAVQAVRRLIPQEAPEREPVRPGLFSRLLGWLTS